MSLLSRFTDEVADGYVLGPVRVVYGALLGYHALIAAETLARVGYFGEMYHASLLPEFLVPSHRVYALVLAARVCLAVMIFIGVWARPALALSAVAGTWILLCDENQFHHNRYCLFLFAFLLSLTPCDRSFRITDPSVPEPRTGPFWAVRLLQLQVAIVYLSSGGSKLVDPDWRNGAVIADRILRHTAQAVAAGVPRGLVELLAAPHTASAIAKLAITTELVLAAGLLFRRTRVVVLFWGVWFHLTIQATSQVETFTVLMLATYGVFATPDYRARTLRFDPSRTWGKIARAAVPLLDWLGRFEVAPWEPDDQPGHSMVVIRRDGGRATGIRAAAIIARCLPLLFPLWAPLALAASFTRRGDLTTRG